jgi:predicted DNA-binding transcriptional regulator YafY
MAWNKNALLRYRTIDKCLQNRGRQWTLDDLIEACSDALCEFEGKDVPVSKRTVQNDIQLMRSDKLGYNAPIVVYDKKYYTYDNPDYTITDVPLSQLDMDVLTESVQMLSQFKSFSLFAELNGVVQKLEDKIHNATGKTRPIIHMDTNEQLRGLEHIDTLYRAIQKQIVLALTYQSFKARGPGLIKMSPYILKEFNNRWFLVGKSFEQDKILTLALDRIRKIDIDLEAVYEWSDFDAETYYANTYGVTVLWDAQLIDIELIINAENAPYVLTKPLHRSQKLLEHREDGRVRIGLRVHHNFELERLLLGFADGIEVVKPAILRQRLRQKYERAWQLHQTVHREEK